MPELPSTNPFSTRSERPFELPPFDEIGEEHFAPAFDAGMAEHRAEVDAIIGNPEPPTFDNTIVALERAGQLLSRTSIVFFNLTGTNSTPTLRGIESDYAPKLTAHSDAIRLDPRLFARIKAVFDAFDDAQDEHQRPRRRCWSSATTSTSCWPAPDSTTPGGPGWPNSTGGCQPCRRSFSRTCCRPPRTRSCCWIPPRNSTASARTR